jgi:hypothetical protein
MFITLTNIKGCARVGQEFAVSRVMELTIGETTQQEVREIFGAPWRTGIEDGLPTWTYGKYHYYLFSADDTQDLVIASINIKLFVLIPLIPHLNKISGN